MGKGSLPFLPLMFLFSAVALKIAQVWRRNVLGTLALDSGAPANLTWKQASDLGLGTRLNDFSFWNWIAVALGTLLLVHAAKRLLNKSDLLIRWSRLDWLVVAIIFVCMFSVYLYSTAYPPTPWEGGFHCQSPDIVYNRLQRAEGVLNGLFLFYASGLLVFAQRVLQHMRRVSTPTPTSKTCKRIGRVLWPLAVWPLLVLVGFFITRTGLSGHDIVPGITFFPADEGLGSFVLPVLFWYGPFLFIVVAFWWRSRGLWIDLPNPKNTFGPVNVTPE